MALMKSRFGRLLCIAWIGALAPMHGFAQVATDITRDGTVGPGVGTQPTNVGGVYEIHESLGERKGTNVLHSFSSFDIGAGDTALFTANAVPTDNVVARITGGPSSIDGTVASNVPNADLFLLNPDGILFGENAEIDVQGAFHATTADTLLMEDAMENQFGAFSGDVRVEVSRPAAFGFLDASPAEITVQGASLEVADGEILSLVGGDLTLEGAELNAESGRIELISVGSAGEVIIGDPAFETSSFSRLGTITLSDESELSTGADDDDVDPIAGGRINMRGRTLRSTDSSTSSLTRGDGDGNAIGIDLRFERRIELWGESEIATGTSDGTGSGGAIFIDARDIVVRDESEIASTTDGDGTSGDVDIEADTLTLRGDAEIASDVESDGTAQGGDVIIDARVVALLGDGEAAPEISSDTEGEGHAGDLRINASEEIRIRSGTGEAAGGLFTNSKPDDDAMPGDEANLGDGGDMFLVTDRLIMDGGEITSETEGAGAGGSIEIDARIARLRDGAKISAESTDAGNAGNIALTGLDELELDDSEITTRSETSLGGNITIVAEDLVILHDSRLQTDVGSGVGSGGNIDIDPTFIVLDDSQIIASADAGNGGNINLVSDFFIATEDSVIDASSNLGVDGEIEITAPESDLSASLVDLPSGFFDDEPLDRSSCAARGSEAAGRFVVTPRPASGASERRLMSFDPGSALPLEDEGDSSRDEVARSPGTEEVEEAEGVDAGGLRGLSAVAPKRPRKPRTNRRSLEEALSAYREFALIAGATDRRIEQVKALANASRIAVGLGQKNPAKKLLVTSHELASELEPSEQKAKALIHIARTWSDFVANVPARRSEYHNRAYNALREAASTGDELADGRIVSYALGSISNLYQLQERVDEALYLNRKAQQVADDANASDALYRWQHREGQLLWARGDREAAIAAYRRAVAVVEELRPESAGQYGDEAVEFKRTVAPVYLDLVDALLETASRDEAGRAQLLEARGTVEQLRAAELRDYYRDECVADLQSKETSIESIATATAIVYPVLFPDRTELIVSLPSGIQRYSSRVGRAAITRAARDFRSELQQFYREGYVRASRRFYDWLVRPYADVLVADGVQTLVFVPDGPLHTIPMAALLDGDEFLADRYAIAVTQSLELVDPQPLEGGDRSVLLAGVSEAVQGFDELPNVPDELDAVKSLRGGKILLDEKFKRKRFESEMAERRPGIVHLATHAVFSGDPETSFLLTHKDRLDMDQLSQIVGQRRFDEEPLELLMLSACETAAGDDRAGLGLAGVAVRAGARSVVGSLWSISDAATRLLVEEFYRQLSDESISKAAALQNAQAALRKDERFAHPFYWSAFLVINNWL